jgi:hypothetical protein
LQRTPWKLKHYKILTHGDPIANYEVNWRSSFSPALCSNAQAGSVGRRDSALAGADVVVISLTIPLFALAAEGFLQNGFDDLSVDRG